MHLSLLLFLVLCIPITWAAEPPPARVITAVVEERVVSPKVRMVGVLRFARVSTVAAEVEGLITSHDFDTGWILEKGTVMVGLNTDFVRKDIEINRSQVAEVEAEIEKLAREVRRLESLRRSEVASRSALDEAFFSHKALLQRKDTLARRRERMQLSLDKSNVRAPFSGIVLEKKKELGDWVDHGDALARLGAIDGMNVIVPVSESLLRFQHKGDEFEVSIPALGQKLKGRLSGMIPFAEARSKSVYLKIALPCAKGMIENLSAEVWVATAQPRRLRLIPRAALLQTRGGNRVYTLVESKATPKEVNIVSRTGEMIAVDDAEITTGMVVVVDGNDRLQPGQAVTVVEE